MSDSQPTTNDSGLLSPVAPSTKRQRQQLGMIRTRLAKLGLAEENYRDMMEGMCAKRSATELTVQEASIFIEAVKEFARSQFRGGCTENQIKLMVFWAHQVKPGADTAEVLRLVEGVLHMAHPTIFSLQNLSEKEASDAIYALKSIARRENPGISRKADHAPRVIPVDFKGRKKL